MINRKVDMTKHKPLYPAVMAILGVVAIAGLAVCTGIILSGLIFKG